MRGIDGKASVLFLLRQHAVYGKHAINTILGMSSMLTRRQL